VTTQLQLINIIIIIIIIIIIPKTLPQQPILEKPQPMFLTLDQQFEHCLTLNLLTWRIW